VQAIVEEVRPRTVLTFGPDGMTGHADHKAVCAWATAAFERAAPPGASIHYATVTRAWADEWVPRMQPFNVYMEPGTPVITDPEDLSIEYVLPPEILDLKLRAIEQHVSQVEGMLSAIGPDVFRRAMATERYRLGKERNGGVS
jgi:LmbE family N-acetylglucosaminyl deacetylase